MMKTPPFPDSRTLPAAISQITGSEVQAMALVCAVGEGRDASVAAYLTPSTAANTPSFRHAIDIENTYSDALLTFVPSPTPHYEAVASVDLDRAARELGVERVLCLVAMDGKGCLTVGRNYDGLEVTLLEAANAQLNRFLELMNEVVQIHSGSMQ